MPGGKRSEFKVLRDIVTLVKKGGQKHEGIHVDFRDDDVLVPVRNLPVPIEPGDMIERRAGFDSVERYEVLDPGYEPGYHNEPACRAKVRSEAAMQREKAQAISHIYQYGANARVNIESDDRSVNTIYVNTGTVFSDLRQAIQNQVVDEADRTELLGRVEALEQAHQSGNYLPEFQSFMSFGANFTTVIGPFLPALAKLLGG